MICISIGFNCIRFHYQSNLVDVNFIPDCANIILNDTSSVEFTCNSNGIGDN